MPDTPERQKQHAQDVQSERWLMQRWSTTREHAKLIMNTFRDQQREAQAKQSGKVEGEVGKIPPPKIPQVETSAPTQFNPREFTVAIPRVPRKPEYDGQAGADQGSTTLIVDDNGTLNYYLFSATFTGAV